MNITGTAALMHLVKINVPVSLDMMETSVTFAVMATFSHHLVVNASCVCYNDHVTTRVSSFPTFIACGGCVDKLVIMHNESIQNIATVQSRLTILYEDLFTIYHQLNNVTLQAVPLMVSLLNVTVMHFIFPNTRI